MCVAWNWSSCSSSASLADLGIGGSSVLGPMYIAEIAPAKWRGRLVGTFQINIVIGVLLAYLSNYMLSTFHLGMAEWRWQLGLPPSAASFPGYADDHWPQPTLAGYESPH